MKEDIKNLEEIINLSKEEIENNDENITAILDLEDLKSLQNLLTRYKQEQLTDKEKEVVEAYRNLVKHTGSDSWVVCDPMQMWSNYFIPKSKVKEKIEELDKRIKSVTTEDEYKKLKIYTCKDFNEFITSVLQELLDS